MRDTTTVALVAGPMVLVGYFVAASGWAWLNRGNPRGNPRGDRRGDRRGDVPDGGAWPPRPAEMAEVLLILVVTWLAEQVIRSVAPGFTFSRVASLSNQVIPVWDSAALWTGLAVLAGLVAPIWNRFRGSTGVAAGVALAVRYVPVVFAAGWLAFLAGLLVFRRARPAYPVALAGAVTVGWLAWVVDWGPAWGVTNGPEASLWVMVCASLLAARWWRGDVLARPGADQ